jgi:biopolymer transport protein TolQ
MPTDFFSLISTAHASTGTLGGQMDILSLVTGSGFVVQSVLYMLVLSSVGCWGIVFHKFRQIREARRQSAEFVRVFWDTKNLTTIYEAVDELSRSPVAQVFRSGYREVVRINKDRQDEATAVRIDSVERAMKRATTEQLTELERSLTFLATTASAAPFIGLFGTVWGIMNAFLGLSMTQSSSIQAVAPGIAEALIATATGLAAAIPAVVAYNYFAREIRVLAADMQNFASEFLSIVERHFLR